MNLDTRARRAAEELRGATGAVVPMTRIAQLKRADSTRRKSNQMLAVVGVIALLACVGWFATVRLGHTATPMPAGPIPTPHATASFNGVDLQPGPKVGAELQPP